MDETRLQTSTWMMPPLAFTAGSTTQEVLLGESPCTCWAPTGVLHYRIPSDALSHSRLHSQQTLSLQSSVCRGCGVPVLGAPGQLRGADVQPHGARAAGPRNGASHRRG